MNLTGQEIKDQGIVFQSNFEIAEENIQQHGIDCELIGVRRILGGGVVPAKGKTILTKYEDMKPFKIHLGENGPEPESKGKLNTLVWQLEPGAYDITLAQGCKIPSDQRLELVQRSSLLRNGAMIVSSLFDAGFETKNIGTVMHVRAFIQIEVGARVCQAYCSTSNTVDKLYSGQWQGDQQRTDGRESQIPATLDLTPNSFK